MTETDCVHFAMYNIYQCKIDIPLNNMSFSHSPAAAELQGTHVEDSGVTEYKIPSRNVHKYIIGTRYGKFHREISSGADRVRSSKQELKKVQANT